MKKFPFVAKLFLVVGLSAIIGVGLGKTVSAKLNLRPDSSEEAYYQRSLELLYDSWFAEPDEDVSVKSPDKSNFTSLVPQAQQTQGNYGCAATGVTPGEGYVLATSNKVQLILGYYCNSVSSPSAMCGDYVVAYVLYWWNTSTNQWEPIRITTSTTSPTACGNIISISTLFPTSIAYGLKGAGLYRQTAFIYSPTNWNNGLYAYYINSAYVDFNVNFWSTW